MSLKEHWYIAAESREVGARPVGRVLMGEPLVLFRSQGAAVALADRCAHRNAALSEGRVVAGRLECRYHGWRYASSGRCDLVPALGPQASLPRLCVRGYPTREQDGYLWVWLGAGEPQGEPFRFPNWGQPGWTGFTMRNRFEGNVESCLENFLDCPHTVFVHRGWFRTSDARALSAVVRRRPDGVDVEFNDEPISPSLVSWLLFPKGRRLRHTDRFLLPSISRVDYEFGPDRHFIITSQCTPVSPTETRVYTAVNFRFGAWGTLVKLFFEPLCRRIIAQDVEIIRAQGRNIARFGGAKFAHLETDLVGLEIQKLRALAEQGLTPGAESAPREVTIRF